MTIPFCERHQREVKQGWHFHCRVLSGKAAYVCHLYDDEKGHLYQFKEVFDSYTGNGNDGVFACGGRLAIRLPYQREFVYSKEQAEAVIQTVLKGFPLNVMYWVKVGTDRYEVLDGQQRTLSVMQYLKHQFSISIDGKKYYWNALPDDRFNAIMNYELMVYICEGEDSEKVDWFEVVNISGEKLSDQELRNSVYTGEWLSDAKRHFSKRKCTAKMLADKYITGDPNRQELLEKALKGICEYQGIKEALIKSPRTSCRQVFRLDCVKKP